jgi:hypothetical protein
VHANDLFVDDGADGKAVEAVSKRFPQLDVIPSLAFIIEPINPVNRSALVVSTKQEEVLRVFDFVSK